MVEADPPSVHAEQVGGGEVVAGRDGLLVLPGPERPEVSVYQAPDGRWLAERDDGMPAEVDDGAEVAAGGRRWVLALPQLFEGTPAFQAVPTLDAVTFRFAVSPDEETVRVSSVHAGRVTALEPLWHGYVLLTLARLRREARASPAPERGWVARDRLLAMLRMDANALNVAIHKARQQLLAVGLAGAAGIVEVRRGERRHGTDRFELAGLP